MSASHFIGFFLGWGNARRLSPLVQVLLNEKNFDIFFVQLGFS